jgi:hypothetical protein
MMENKIVLTDAGFSKLQEVLDNPPEATQALKDLMNMTNWKCVADLNTTFSPKNNSVSWGHIPPEGVVKNLLQYSQELYEEREKEALLELINIAKEDIRNGDTFTLEEIIASIKAQRCL